MQGTKLISPSQNTKKFHVFNTKVDTIVNSRCTESLETRKEGLQLWVVDFAHINKALGTGRESHHSHQERVSLKMVGPH